MRAILAIAALASAAPAQAVWFQASSRHFLIYSEQKPSDLRDFAEKLERFDQAVRLTRKVPEMPLSKGNRLTVFVLPNVKEVQRLANDNTGFIEGFYRGRGAGSVAYVPRRISGNPEADVSTILLHEYAHHLMFQDIDSPYPEWLVEGFAEFMSVAKFERDGTVGIGMPNVDRSYALFQGQTLPIETLLGNSYGNLKLNAEQHESIYARGWLMTHYFTFEPVRQKQFLAYIHGMAMGVDPLESAKAAFGDLKKLDRELGDYLRQPKLHYLRIPGSLIKVGPIDIGQVSAGASAAIPILAEIKNDPASTAAKPLAARLKSVEAQYPGDAFVETALAEAELDSDDPAGAESAADKALKADPQSTEAMILKGRASTANLARSDSATAAKFEDARDWFLKANKIDPEDPEPLYEFYRSFVEADIQPTQNAIDALHYASDLAPQDLGLRITSAALYAMAGKSKDARTALVLVAYDPHGGETAAMARRMISRIDAGDTSGALNEAGWSVTRTPAH